MKLTKELLHELIVIQGKSYSEVARSVGVNLSSVSVAARKFGTLSQHQAKAASKDLPVPIEQVYLEYTSGTSLDELHHRLGRPVAAIKRKLKAAYPSIVFRSHDEAVRPAELNDDRRLLEWAGGNRTARQIAKELKVKEATVVAAYRRMNVRRFTRDLSPVLPKADLHDLYWRKLLNLTDIAQMYGTTPQTVADRLREYGFAVRGCGGTRSGTSMHRKLMEADWLGEQHIHLGRSMADIARELGTAVGNVSHFLKLHGYEPRTKEEVCDKLQVHGTKVVHESKRHGRFECDSLLELAFLEQQEEAGSITKPSALEYNGILYYPDFDVDGQVVEVKSPMESREPGVNRTRLMKQYWVAKRNGVSIRVWNGRLEDVSPTDLDVWYCQDWRLVFDSDKECADWLLKVGFLGLECARYRMYDGLRRLSDILKSDNDLLSNTIQATEVMDTIKHFSQHYFRSHHHEYNPVAAAWEAGNTAVLRSALSRLWSGTGKTGRGKAGATVNINGLVHTIGKYFKDFSPVSIFKPWVARHVYNRYLPGGGTIVDPCMGWGGRLLGCLDGDYSYLGSDLNPLAVQSNTDLRGFLRGRVGKCEFRLLNAAVCELPQGDLLLTSPPYNNLERYHGLDCVPDTSEILRNIFRQFRGTIALNVPKWLAGETVTIAGAYGRPLRERLEMQTSSFMGRERTSEPILVF